MQTSFLKIIVALCISFSAQANFSSDLKKADSLFDARQFTQSYQLYHSIFEKNVYSSSMILKMAYIQEGLGHIGLCLFYLNLYQHLTNDSQAISKIKEIASAHQLEGYDTGFYSAFLSTVKKNKTTLLLIGCSVSILLWAWLLFQKRKNRKLIAPTVLLVLFSVGILFFINEDNHANVAISSTQPVYVMSAPSSGASVIAIIQDGHRFYTTGKKDVWVHINWKGEEGYIKENHLLTLPF